MPPTGSRSRPRGAQVEAALGPVDILVNAPGVNSATPFLEISLDEWHRLLDANLTAVLVACQVFGRAMIAHGRGGSIINMSSASSGPPLSRVLTYSVAKAGLNNLTQYLARELAPHADPGQRDRPGLLPGRAEPRAAVRGPPALDHVPHAGRPAGRAARAGRARRSGSASAAASGYVTGAIVRVDGGFSAMTI